jgi:hypothetical protein
MKDLQQWHQTSKLSEGDLLKVRWARINFRKLADPMGQVILPCQQSLAFFVQ